MSEILSLLLQLISCPSITPNDADCQKIIAARLEKAGFHTETMQFDNVTNLWARIGKDKPLIVFVGHTDVVPPGPESAWTTPPFQGTVKDGLIYGRGTSDMKGALAAMVIAAENFVANHSNFKGSIGFLITSDEEGPSINGTQKVMQELIKRGEKIDYAIVGEPSSIDKAGDQIRIGRRGSLHGKLTIYGKQGHVAYPNLVINPIHKSMQALGELSETKWDEGNTEFPPTSFQITNINAGTGAANVVPGQIEVLFNFRFGTANTIEKLQKRVEATLNKIGLKYDLKWTIGAEPFLTGQGQLLAAVQKAIKEVSGLTPLSSTAGGTSDARFLAPTGTEVIELGTSHATAHHVDEHVKTEDLLMLEKYYSEILKLIFEKQV